MKTFYINGYTIIAGQNARENDVLTLGASGNDMWFHAENIPGSHVIIKDAIGITQDIIQYAASLAADFSKARGNANNVNVIYTNIYNVEKNRFSKAGEVTVKTFQRVRVKI
jgi:predicted ribosome quality control (RQC) complex YloA/Tae2 family protein